MRSPLVMPPGADCIPFEKAEIEGSIGARFRKVAQRFPDRPAVREAGRVTTYAELAGSAGRIARGMLERLGTKPGPVVLMCDPGAPLFAAMLGTLEAGRFYVPLDPGLPVARLEAILRDARRGGDRRGRRLGRARAASRGAGGRPADRGAGCRASRRRNRRRGFSPTTSPTSSSRRARRACPRA